MEKTPPVSFSRPSIDVLFQSIPRSLAERSIAVLLTGMGKDGASGLKSIYETGGYTIAQNQQSSAIFGMPKAAIELGAVRRVLPFEEIPNELLRLTNLI